MMGSGGSRRLNAGGGMTRWVNADGDTIAQPVRTADTFVRRLVGLQFARTMPVGEALWLQNCGSVHTAWMRFSIDLFFMDVDLRIVAIRRSVVPWRIAMPGSDPQYGGQPVKHIIEARHLPGAADVAVGDQTHLVDA